MNTVNKNMAPLEVVRAVCQAADAMKAEDIVILDLRGRTFFTDYFVIMSGRSTRHVQSIAETIEEKLGRKRSASAEGRQEGHWILLDLDDVIVHVFYRESRLFYNLEELWHDAPRVPIPGAPAPA